MLKKIIFPAIMLILLICAAPKASAAGGVSARVAGHSLSGAFISDDVTLVPLRDFCSVLAPDCSISWDAATRSVTVRSAGLELTARSGCEYITANGRYLYVGKNSFITPQGSFVLPLRSLAKAFDAAVTWNAQSRTAAVTPGSGAIKSGDGFYSSDAVYWLSRIISAEARGESLAGQIAVGNVVMNRVASADYPDTIYGVIFDRACGVQFTPTANGTIYDTPTESAVIAARLVLDGADVAGDCLYFLNERIATSLWIVRNRTWVTTIGNHSFYV